jgi:hypothetical protein
MVLPEDVADWCISLMVPQIADIGGRKVELAFDIAAANDILPRHHETKLIQHVFRGPAFDNAASLERIDPRACLWHSDKDGGLIRLLRGRILGGYSGDAEGIYEPTVETGVKPEPKVHTYYRPCDDPDALAEQKRILAIWERSWRAAGFEPVILTEAHAKEHPKFEEYRAAFEAKPTINPKAYEMACWLRWVAMAQIGGTLLDYDVLPFGFLPSQEARVNSTLPLMLCASVPCAVMGYKSQYESAIDAFVTCAPTHEQGQPHLSDMHAAQQLGFRSVDICREYGTAGWKEAKLVHFNHYSCNPRKRSECMEGSAAERELLSPSILGANVFPREPENGSPCVICGNPITAYDSYGVGALARYHWECICREAATVSPPPCTPTNGQTAVSNVSPTAPAKRRPYPRFDPVTEKMLRDGEKHIAKQKRLKRSPEQIAKDKARMAKVRAAKLAKV